MFFVILFALIHSSLSKLIIYNETHFLVDSFYNDYNITEQLYPKLYNNSDLYFLIYNVHNNNHIQKTLVRYEVTKENVSIVIQKHSLNFFDIFDGINKSMLTTTKSDTEVYINLNISNVVDIRRSSDGKHLLFYVNKNGSLYVYTYLTIKEIKSEIESINNTRVSHSKPLELYKVIYKSNSICIRTNSTSCKMLEYFTEYSITITNETGMIWIDDDGYFFSNNNILYSCIDIQCTLYHTFNQNITDCYYYNKNKFCVSLETVTVCSSDKKTYDVTYDFASKLARVHNFLYWVPPSTNSSHKRYTYTELLIINIVGFIIYMGIVYLSLIIIL